MGMILDSSSLLGTAPDSCCNHRGTISGVRLPTWMALRSRSRVTCMKHIFEAYVVLQFEVSNGLPDQRLHNVLVKVECR